MSAPPGSEPEVRSAASLTPEMYSELRKLARARLRGQTGLVGRPSATSLVHETYLRLGSVTGMGENEGPEDRRRFFSLASTAMRSILVDNARYWLRQKRGGGARPLQLEESHLVTLQRSEEILALDECLERLSEARPDLADIVEHRVFAGLTVEETAEALGVSMRTVKRGWASARVWLYAQLETTSVLSAGGN